MKKQSPNLEAEGTQPDNVRELLEAGRNDAAGRGYNVEAGLARHLAQVQAGAPLPPWAHELVAGSGGAAAAAAGVTATKLATGKIVAGVVLAVITAGTIAAVVIGAPENSGHVAPPPASPRIEAPVAPLGAGQAPSADEAAAGQADDPVELEIAPITSSRPKRSGHAATQAEREAEVEAKPSPSRAHSAKTIDALIEAVGKQGGSSTRPASQGHVDLVAPSAATERAGAQADQTTSPTSEPSERVEQTSRTPAPAPVVDDSRLEREMGMLAVAQKVLKSDPERALRLARQGEQEFAGSMFTQERQQVLLLALIELGRISEAKRLALPYLKRYPNGPFSDRLRSALAAAKPEN